MVASHEQHGWARTAGDHGDRDRDKAVSRPVHRMGQADEAGVLAAHGKEIEFWAESGCHGLG